MMIEIPINTAIQTNRFPMNQDYTLLHNDKATLMVYVCHKVCFIANNRLENIR